MMKKLKIYLMIKKMTDINYSIQSQIFVDGISKNERHYTDNQPVFVSKEQLTNKIKIKKKTKFFFLFIRNHCKLRASMVIKIFL